MKETDAHIVIMSLVTSILFEDRSAVTAKCFGVRSVVKRHEKQAEDQRELLRRLVKEFGLPEACGDGTMVHKALTGKSKPMPRSFLPTSCTA